MKHSPPELRTHDTAPPDVTEAIRRAVIASVLLTGALLIIGAMGRVVVFDGAIGDTEADLVRWVADHRIDDVDAGATIGSTLSDTWTVIGVLIGAVTMLLASGHKRSAGLMLVGMGLEFTAFLAVGALIGRSRPEADALHSVPSTPSFPSGHVAAAIVVYGSLVLIARAVPGPGRVPRQAWIVPPVVAVVVAASRVYEGVHFPTDVLAGMVLGVGALYGAAFTMGFTDGFGSRRTERA